MRNKEIRNRVLEEARFFIDNHSTVRATAKAFGISKSTVHIDLSERLWDISPLLANEVYKVLNQNLLERAARGGEATRRKYLNLK